MNRLYAPGEANFPRLTTDTLFQDPRSTYLYHGPIDEATRYIEGFQLLDHTLWARFVDQFRRDADFEGGWRGEYWGKMLRGACFVYSYTKNPALYAALRKTVLEMLETQADSGRISSYGVEHEFDAWDLWSRKYVLLGMQYFSEICPEEALKATLLSSMCRQADYIMAHIGEASEGKLPITSATRNWRGLNSSSILEPIVRLYNLTGEQKYLDFASYIVSIGGTEIEDLFTLAYDDKLEPYQYPITKAYEMTSCFEGLLEYYRATGIERHKEAVIRFADRVLAGDFTVIGSSGCTHELFDHSTVRQANTTNGEIMQETCVTVTLMKFFSQLTLLTGDPKYADAFEISMYNAYLGAVNTERVIESSLSREHPDWCLEPLPFDSYSPLTAGTRGNGIGGLKLMSDKHYYGCCACIGSAGLGLIHKMSCLTSRTGLVLNLYLDGEIKALTPSGSPITLRVSTSYPKGGTVTVMPELSSPEAFDITLRIPAWSNATTLTLNRETLPCECGYLTLSRTWKTGDTLTLSLDMQTRVLRPTPYGHQILMNKMVWDHDYAVPVYDEEDPLAKHHLALLRGPIVLAQESRLGYSVDEPVDILTDGEHVNATLPAQELAPYPHILEVEIPLRNGTSMRLTDYASAGKLWSDESRMAAWILTV